MAKHACPYCDGFAHTSGEIPNPNESLLISDVEFESVGETIDSDVLYEQFKHLFKCVSCDAIAIFWRGLSDEPTWYSPRYQGSSPS